MWDWWGVGGGGGGRIEWIGKDVNNEGERIHMVHVCVCVCVCVCVHAQFLLKLTLPSLLTLMCAKSAHLAGPLADLRHSLS